MTDNKLNIKPGDVWVTYDGRIARVYATDAGSHFPIHGAVKWESDDVWSAETWTEAGFRTIKRGPIACGDLHHKYDWRQELAPIWAALKPEWTWLAMDVAGEWFAYHRRPHINIHEEVLCGEDGSGEERITSRAFALPTPDCPWYETATERPEVKD